MTEEIEIPLGAFDSETIGWTYTIPEGFTAKIEDGKIIVEKQDENIRKEIIEFLTYGIWKQSDIDKVKQSQRYAKWVAYLEEQKPAEWSEEDEEMYARVVRRYTDYEGVIMRTKEESVADKMLNAMAQEEIWLKSLRPQPHWKPSEEQIQALQSTMYDYKDVPWYNQLLSLYNDLKKL